MERKKPFKIGQYIVIKWRPVESVMPCPLGLMYSEANHAEYGVWEVQPYEMDNGIDYKMHLVPVGKSAEKFLPMNRYTSDYIGPFGVKPEMVFDDWKLAEKFIEEFPLP